MAALLTIAHVARAKGVSEKTVRRDIAAGRLEVVRVDGHVFIAKSEADGYRALPFPPTDWLTPRQLISELRRVVAKDMGVEIDDLQSRLVPSLRSLRRRIRDGTIPVVRLSSRRCYVRNDWVQEWTSLNKRAPGRHRTWVRRLRPGCGDEVTWVIANVLADLPCFALEISDVAVLARKSPRQVHHDIAKGALVPYFTTSKRGSAHVPAQLARTLPHQSDHGQARGRLVRYRNMRIPVRAAVSYAARHNATPEAIDRRIATVAVQLCHVELQFAFSDKGEPLDANAKAAIARGLVAWLRSQRGQKVPTRK